MNQESTMSLASRQFKSLLSQKDRKNTIEALEFYLKYNDLGNKSELNALLNWIKLEYYKEEFKKE